MAETNREKLQDSQQGTRIHCPKLQQQEHSTNAPTLQIPCPTPPGICSPVLVTTLRRDIDKMERVQRRAKKWIPRSETIATNNGSRTWNSLASFKGVFEGNLLRWSSIRTFNNVNPIGLFDYDFNDRTWNNWKKLIVKRFDTSVAQHFFPINIKTTWNALPYDVVNRGTGKTLKNHLDTHCEDNPPDVLVNW